MKQLLSLTILLAVTVCADAAAQSGKIHQYGDGTNGMVWLFRMAEVQIELNTTPQQMHMIFALQADLQEQTQNTFAAARDGGPEEKKAISQKDVRRTIRKINHAGEEILSAILDDTQFARARQLILQLERYRAFERAEFARQMKLTTIQQGKIEKILTRERLSDDDEEEIIDLLTTRQHKLWMTLKGPAFRFPPRRKSNLPEDDQ